MNATHNTGIKVANGEYWNFEDSDDYIAENMYFILYRRLVNLDIVIGNYRIAKDGVKQGDGEIWMPAIESLRNKKF